MFIVEHYHKQQLQLSHQASVEVELTFMVQASFVRDVLLLRTSSRTEACLRLPGHVERHKLSTLRSILPAHQKRLVTQYYETSNHCTRRPSHSPLRADILALRSVSLACTSHLYVLPCIGPACLFLFMPRAPVKQPCHHHSATFRLKASLFLPEVFDTASSI